MLTSVRRLAGVSRECANLRCECIATDRTRGKPLGGIKSLKPSVSCVGKLGTRPFPALPAAAYELYEKSGVENEPFGQISIVFITLLNQKSVELHLADRPPKPSEYAFIYLFYFFYFKCIVDELTVRALLYMLCK